MEEGMKEIKNRLLELGKKFIRFYAAEEYYKAKQCYDTARTVACFIGFDENDMNELFGNRDRNIAGEFPENVVQRVFYHTCVKGNEDRTQESLADNELRHMQRRLMGIYAKK